MGSWTPKPHLCGVAWQTSETCGRGWSIQPTGHGNKLYIIICLSGLVAGYKGFFCSIHQLGERSLGSLMHCPSGCLCLPVTLAGCKVDIFISCYMNLGFSVYIITDFALGSVVNSIRKALRRECLSALPPHRRLNVISYDGWHWTTCVFKEAIGYWEARKTTSRAHTFLLPIIIP